MIQACARRASTLYCAFVFERVHGASLESTVLVIRRGQVCLACRPWRRVDTRGRLYREPISDRIAVSKKLASQMAARSGGLARLPCLRGLLAGTSQPDNIIIERRVSVVNSLTNCLVSQANNDPRIARKR